MDANSISDQVSLEDLYRAMDESLPVTSDSVELGTSKHHNDEVDHDVTVKKPPGFLKKYFWEGQILLNDDSSVKTDDSPLWRRLFHSRRLRGVLIPFLFFQVLWWLLAVKHNYFRLFNTRYVMSIAMIGGAMVAGMTSQGGGSVAFPVMTLCLNIDPEVARDFSLMIQSCGMSAAAFTIYWMRIKIEKHALYYCSLGATFGMVFGLEVIDHLLEAAIKKLGFVSIWLTFAFALYLLNRHRDRPTFDSLPTWGVWECGVLVVGGFVGGVFSALCGCGVDIASFSVLCLLFRVNEKVAVPTSLILMAINSFVGFFWRALMTPHGVEPEAWSYLAVCVPVVVLVAPLSSMLSSHFHRLVIAGLIYFVNVLAFVTALSVVPMLPAGDVTRVVMVTLLVVGGVTFFLVLSRLGKMYCDRVIKKEGDEDGDEI